VARPRYPGSGSGTSWKTRTHRSKSSEASNLCAVDKNGVQPIQIRRIPSHLSALMQTNINVQGLTLEAIIQQDPQRIYQAAMLDPHTAAELDLDQIWALVDDLIAAHGEWIPKPLRTNSRESPRQQTAPEWRLRDGFDCFSWLQMQLRMK
jgi:Family 4 glycosyl hydrolase C-terminal domain